MLRVMRLSPFFALGLLATAGCAPRVVTSPEPLPPAPPTAITEGRSLLQAMRARYRGRWFQTLSFLQNNTLYASTGRETKSQWREYIAVPGRLRIDYVPLSSKSGVLYAGGRVYAFQDGRQADVRPGMNVLLLLVADVYVRPPDSVVRLLDSLGFRTDVMHRGVWHGAPVYVIGARAGDTTTSQFWVDSARRVVVRVIQKERRGDREVVSDYHLNKYTDVGGWPVALEVLQHRDGRLVFKEEYAEIRVNDPIPDDVFDPAKWSAAQINR